jgi:hypothetical protein
LIKPLVFSFVPGSQAKVDEQSTSGFHHQL